MLRTAPVAQKRVEKIATGRTNGDIQELQKRFLQTIILDIDDPALARIGDTFDQS
jgi:hypothetical protein